MDSEKKLPLPRFRRDLKIYTGPFEADGSPTYNIYDPAKGQFYKISWKESLVFKSFTGEQTAEELATKINHEFPVTISTEDVTHFFTQAYLLGLLRVPKDGETLYKIHTHSKGSLYSWLIINYLFLKVPLFHPDAFLTRTVRYVRFLGSWPALLFYFVIIVVGFATLIGRFDQFMHTFSYFFTLEGLILYGAMISCVKIIHEFAHAYVAKNYGLYVPTMGVGLLVLFPVLYTDVTEGWKLAKRQERFYISFAGVAAELVVAGFATIGWILSSPGIFQSLCFVLASTSWFSTIVININPAVRFDGYYILSDLWGVDNLMGRAFAVTRWKFHQWLFGLDDECPEPNLSPRRTAGFVIYTVYTIIYRLFLYTAIALFVYYEFTKALGIFLFLAEIWIFFIMPVIWETQALYKVRSKLTWNWHSLLTSTLALLLVLWFIVPLPHKVSLPAVIVSQNLQVIYSPEEGRIKQMTATRGQEVEPGSPLVVMESDGLQLEIAKAEYQHQILTNELFAVLNDPEQQNLIAQKKAEIDQNEQIMLGLSKREAKLDIRAEIQGTLADWQTDLKPGQYAHKGQIFGSVFNLDKMEAIVYASEINAEDFKVGQPAVVIIQKSSPIHLKGTIQSIDRKRTNALIYPGLASIYGGPLAVTPFRTIESDKLILHDSYYEIIISLNAAGETLYFGEPAEIKIQGPWRSYLVEGLKYLYRAVYKESSF